LRNEHYTIDMKSRSLLFLFILCSFPTLFSQAKLDTVVAKTGDGIFSILRNSGIHPVKYYVNFLDLNKDQIKGASELVEGRKYILPFAPDSFKNMGVLIDVDEAAEAPIFNSELGQLAQKDSTLKNAVYYLIYPNITTEAAEGETLDDFTNALSKDLLERGARVYVLKKNKMHSAKNEVNFENDIVEFGEFASIVNKKYLKHNGSYQRVLIIRDSEKNTKGISIAMHHYDKSEEGQKLAASFRDIFKNNARGKTNDNQGIAPFTDELSLYLAKNLLPSVTIMNINGDANGILVRSKKSSLPELITKGILQDHANLNFTE